MDIAAMTVTPNQSTTAQSQAPVPETQEVTENEREVASSQVESSEQASPASPDKATKIELPLKGITAIILGT